MFYNIRIKLRNFVLFGINLKKGMKNYQISCRRCEILEKRIQGLERIIADKDTAVKKTEEIMMG